MYEIVQLVAASHGYTVRQTEYALMQREAALELIAELTADAIDDNSDGRWTIIPSPIMVGRSSRMGFVILYPVLSLWAFDGNAATR